MSAIFKEISEYLQLYTGNSLVVIGLYLLGLGVLCFYGKRIRVLLVYPSLLLTLIIVNPICYVFIWKKLLDYAYWRMLWMIPIVPVLVTAVIMVISSLNNIVTKGFAICLFCGLIIFLFNNLYTSDVFVEAGNPYKIPDSAIIISDKLLEYDSEPKVLASPELYSYLRQYNSKIKLIFGRNADGFIWWYIGDELVQELVNFMRTKTGDTTTFCSYAKARCAEFIVLPENHEFDGIENNGYEQIEHIEGFIIYRAKD